jgi:hypothetical protein
MDVYKHERKYYFTHFVHTFMNYFWYLECRFIGLWCLMPLSTILSYIMAVSFIGWGNRSTQRKPPTCRKSLTNFITKCYIEYTSSWAGFELTTLVVIGTDCTGSCKSNYYMITTMTVHIQNAIVVIP